MTAMIPEDSPEDFARRLRKFYLDCGKQSYRTMERDSRKLAEWYPEVFTDVGRAPTLLTRNTLCLQLALKRKTLPDPGWLTSVLLICQRHGFQTNSLPQDTRGAILAEWHERLRRARIWAEHNGDGKQDPAEREEDGPQSPPTPCQPPPQPAPPLSAPPPISALPPQIIVAASTRPLPPSASPPPQSSRRDRRQEDEPPAPSNMMEPGIVSPAQQAHLERHGSYGHLLAKTAAAGCAQAAYEAGVLLRCAHDSAQAALPLLRHAAACGHLQAQQLLLAAPDRIDRLDIAAHAYELAETAAEHSRTAEALLWYERAARNGLPAAAMKLALCHQARGEEALTLRWLAVAAQHGYTQAQDTLAELRRPDRFSRPPATGHRAVGGARTPYN
jgi:hypothetical protein